MSRRTVIILLGVIAALLVFTYAAFPPLNNEPRKPAADAASTSTDPVVRGKALAQQLGCVGCHTADGNTAAGPTWKGLAGSQVKLITGSTVTADDAYLRESIVNPDAKIVEGYGPGVMGPAVDAVRSRRNENGNIDALIAYINSLK
jgi:cytochrome c551/c552